MRQEEIVQNIEKVRENIAKACRKAGRDPKEVTLIAVTKTVSAETAMIAVDAGVCDIGENRVQEYRDKRDKIQREINLHFIGQLQRNKVKYIVSDVSYIHSLDRLSLAEEISARAQKAGRTVNVLVEVGFDHSGERGGVLPEQLHEFVYQLQEYPNLNVCGLMCVAPLGYDEEKTRGVFRTMRDMRDAFQKEGLHMPHLSMGMSGDYQIAVEEGATFVRIGTTIFGARK